MFNFDGVKESNGGQWISPGIQEVTITEVKLSAISTAAYNGEVMDVTFEDREGRKHNKRIFPYKFNQGAKDFKGNPLSDKDQQTEYLARITHLFSPMYPNLDAFKLSMKGANSFPAMVNCLAKCVNGTFFRCKFIYNNKGFTNIRDAKYGVTERLDVNPSKLRFDLDKEGTKPEVAGAESHPIVSNNPISPSNTDDLPF
jgi:hypothetical protein